MENITSEKEIDGYKVALAIRQIESTGVFHECLDIEEEGVENILPQYGIFYKWTEDEKAILKEELMEMAAKEEIKEAVRWEAMETDPVILAIQDRPTPSPRILELQHKLYKAEMKAQQSASMTEPDPNDWADSILKEQKLGVM